MGKRFYAVLAGAGIVLLVGAFGSVLMKGKENVPMRNRLPEKAEKGLLQTTFQFEEKEGGVIAYQNGIPVPTFEPQRRNVLTLSGTWKKERFAADHDQTMAPRSREWVRAVEEAAEGRTAEKFDDSGWEDIELPLPENIMTGEESAAGAETYEDGVWYRRTFELDDSWSGQAVTLKSLGVSYIADIWINGQWAGMHEGGFTPFALDVTPFVRSGANTIAVRVDNPPWGSRIDTIPAVAGTDFFNYTGIIQEMYLEAAPYVHMVRADIVPQEEDGRLLIRAVVENRGNRKASVTLAGAVYEAVTDSEKLLASPYPADIIGAPAETEGMDDRDIELAPLEARLVTWNVRVKEPKRWTMETPHLYVAEFSVRQNGTATATDRLATQFGIRTIRTDKRNILLNGEPVFLRGIARHEEWPVYGRTASWERIVRDLEQIRGLNANMVRTGHYPNHVYTYLATDRLGLAAMSEIPLWQFETIHYEAQQTRRLADQMWREMVFSQYNRPSVIMWSTQNESKDVMLRKAYNERLVRDIRTFYDDGRLVTQSAAADQPGPWDESMEPLDVAAWTMYFGIFHGGTPYEGTRDFVAEAARRWPDKPLLNTEFGYWTGETDLEADRQAEIYNETLRALMEHATVTMDGRPNPEGVLAGIDFWTAYNWYVNHGQWSQTMGIYHMDRTTAKPVRDLIREDYARISGKPAR